MRNNNCRRSGQAEQATNCTRKSQRIRCCGHVATEQQINNENRGKGQGKCLANGQGQQRV